MIQKYLKMEMGYVKKLEDASPRKPPKKFQFLSLPDDMQYHVFSFLSCRQLAQCLRLQKGVRTKILDAMRSIFWDIFGRFPEGVATKTLFWVLRRAHRLDSK